MRCRGIILCSLSALFFTACSTTRILQEDEYRLMKNNVTIQGEKELRTSDISPYIKQQANSFFPFGINPFVSIYNWSDGSDKPLSRNDFIIHRNRLAFCLNMWNHAGVEVTQILKMVRDVLTGRFHEGWIEDYRSLSEFSP